MTASTLNETAVLVALSEIQNPLFGKDIVALNQVSEITIQDGQISLDLSMPTFANPHQETMIEQMQTTLSGLSGASQVTINSKVSVLADGNQRSQPIKNIIAIASGKGGVGKSTVAVNLAVGLAKAGANVGLLDADIYGPNIPTMMGLKHLPQPVDSKIIPAEAYGVKVMSIGFLVPPDQPIVWRGPMLHSAIQQFTQDVAWGELDYLIIDLPPGTGDTQLSLAQTTPLTGGVIVTLPQQVSLDDARRGLEMFRQLNVPILGVVENMSFLELPGGEKMDIFGTGGGERLATDSKPPFLGSIPIDPQIRTGGDLGKPIIVTNPDSAAAVALQEIAQKTITQAAHLVYDQSGAGFSIEVVD